MMEMRARYLIRCTSGGFLSEIDNGGVCCLPASSCRAAEASLFLPACHGGLASAY